MHMHVPVEARNQPSMPFFRCGLLYFWDRGPCCPEAHPLCQVGWPAPICVTLALRLWACATIPDFVSTRSWGIQVPYLSDKHFNQVSHPPGSPLVVLGMNFPHVGISDESFPGSYHMTTLSISNHTFATSIASVPQEVTSGTSRPVELLQGQQKSPANVGTDQSWRNLDPSFIACLWRRGPHGISHSSVFCLQSSAECSVHRKYLIHVAQMINRKWSNECKANFLRDGTDASVFWSEPTTQWLIRLLDGSSCHLDGCILVCSQVWNPKAETSLVVLPGLSTSALGW